jgi:hypothetical protein
MVRVRSSSTFLIHIAFLSRGNCFMKTFISQHLLSFRVPIILRPLQG